ncbi:hypothetical protein HYH03_000212 [Edaphochlamys debaryana]|uniref:Protein kinase domain-containing protein n=1 Tax=Edaphochlamys debaryana TaxID=47281 RepID=A0A835YIT0_9CHLO|nr:hypothetical protein HYH03_000212 [Edaphochlamys debaryana]|eukprot:KAG2501711.1 hypothetical protein HYH03_000212 [Edaphochlamys debaryana]
MASAACASRGEASAQQESETGLILRRSSFVNSGGGVGVVVTPAEPSPHHHDHDDEVREGNVQLEDALSPPNSRDKSSRSIRAAAANLKAQLQSWWPATRARRASCGPVDADVESNIPPAQRFGSAYAPASHRRATDHADHHPASGPTSAATSSACAYPASAVSSTATSPCPYAASSPGPGPYYPQSLSQVLRVSSVTSHLHQHQPHPNPDPSKLTHSRRSCGYPDASEASSGPSSTSEGTAGPGTPGAPQPSCCCPQPPRTPPPAVAPVLAHKVLPPPPVSHASAVAQGGIAPLSPALQAGAGGNSHPTPVFNACPTRPLPGEGLFYMSPSARASMWTARRGVRWSLREYSLTRKLYQGYASKVYQATCLTSSQEVVLKVYSLTQLTTFLTYQVLRELDIHSRLRHPGVVQLLAAFREGDNLVLVLEYVRGGSLESARRKLGGRLSEPWAVHLVLLPLLRALAAVHKMGVVHRDIKPENLLFTPDWRLKLCDFGVSVALHDERAVTRAGSPEYMAPEVSACPLKHTPADNKVDDALAYGTAADVFSIGALAYELLVGFTPYPSGPPAATVAASKVVRCMTDPHATPAPASAAAEPRKPAAPVQLAFPGSVSPAARAFITACLQPHPGDRPTVDQLLSHEWVVGQTAMLQSAAEAQQAQARQAQQQAVTGAAAQQPVAAQQQQPAAQPQSQPAREEGEQRLEQAPVAMVGAQQTAVAVP